MSQEADHRAWTDAAEHVAAYRATGGVVGHTWHDRPHLLLSTAGRRSGREHTVPLVYSRVGSEGSTPVLAVVASAGGSERHPAWYLNLAADPDVGVQLRSRSWRTRAVVAGGEQEEQAWQAMGRAWTGFAVYRRETARRIPVVLLPGPPDGLP